MYPHGRQLVASAKLWLANAVHGLSDFEGMQAGLEGAAMALEDFRVEVRPLPLHQMYTTNASHSYDEFVIASLAVLQHFDKCPAIPSLDQMFNSLIQRAEAFATHAAGSACRMFGQLTAAVFSGYDMHAWAIEQALAQETVKGFLAVILDLDSFWWPDEQPREQIAMRKCQDGQNLFVGIM